uniref:Doublecortin domain-containing protein n=1 Tax=Oreochromis aureus TaxID=47969 RepID=A0A668U6L6_OREAU
MSSRRRHFHSFDAVGGEGTHRSSIPFKRHSTRLPRIPQHGMVAHHEPTAECYLCSECRHAHALEAVETQLSPFYHTHPSCHHHHPHHYVLSGPSRPEETPLDHERHIHHHRYSKKLVLVKNSDPSFRKTIILHRRGLRSLGLFLEEVSELMQYHIRKLYTVGGHKIDSVQSLLQCPGVLVCVGREPSHPSIVENFRKTSDDKLPKLSVRSRSGGLPAKKSVIHPNLESGNKVIRQSVSSDKSGPDGTDSPDNVNSCPPTGDGVREDDIEKRVRVNKDGSLSMEMKVRFRLQNDETLHWSTEVKKTTGRTCEYHQGNNNPYFPTYLESENISAVQSDEHFMSQHYQRHQEESHCPHCCGHCQDYEIWKNASAEESIQKPPGNETELRTQSTMSGKSNTSGKSTKSSASEDPHTGNAEERSERTLSEMSVRSVKSNESAISRKLNDETEETREATSAMSATSTSSARSKGSKRPDPPDATECVGSSDDINTEEQSGERPQSILSVKSAKSVKSSISAKSCRSKHGEQGEEKGPSSLSVKSVQSNVSAKSKGSNTSAKSNMSAPTDIEAEEKAAVNDQYEERPPSNTSTTSAKSLKSNASAVTPESCSDASEETNIECETEGESVSSLSVTSDISATSFKSKEEGTEMLQEANDEEETEQRPPSCLSAKSLQSHVSEISAERVPSALSAKSAKSRASNTSNKPKTYEVCACQANERNGEEETQERAQSEVSNRSGKSTNSAKSPKSKDHEEENISVHTENEERAPSNLSVRSGKSGNQSKRNVPNRINGDLNTKESGGSVTDKKTDKSSKYLHKSTEAHDFDLVPSSLPNASPTEVVNEWLKTLPAEGELDDVEEFNENHDGPKTVPATEEINRVDTVNNPTENSKGPVEGEAKKCVPNNDCETSKETTKEDNASTDADNASKVFNSSIQVMKVLLNPKLDRCNSLPEISPAYGRKLSSSARGFLDCLVKLQLIDRDPKNANEKNERYQELMGILQSLWLCDPPENEHALRKDDHHFADDDFNHTSSSGVDVNSGSTGSGNSSDGIKRGNDVNGDVSQTHATVDVFMKVQQVCEVETDADVQSTSVRKAEGMCEDKQKEVYPASTDSPREQSETPHSSNKSSRNFSEGQKLPEAETDSSENSNSESPLLIEREELAKMISQDDPAWVLTLLNKIEKQFMTHYIKAMNEFKARWNLGDNEQLDSMINELRAEVHKRIQVSIDRELWKIQTQKGQPRPPRETKSSVSTTQAEERRRKLKVNLKPSTDSHAEKSDDSATGTSYSDQRSENDDECCQCETCIKKKKTCRAPLQGDSMTTVPAATAIKCVSHPGNIHETQAAETLVEKVIVKALREVGEVHPGTEDISTFLMKADGSDATADEPLNGPTEEAESEDTEDSSEEKSKEDVAEGTMVQDEDTHVAGAT